MDYPILEDYFQTLTDLTDKIAVMNTHYDNDTVKELSSMEEVYSGMIEIPWEGAGKEYYGLFTSHLTFHLRIVKEIIQEAREILNPDNREHVKNLVIYVKRAEEWFNEIGKKRKSLNTVSVVN